MKKIITFILCFVLLIGATSLVSFAEEDSAPPVEPNTGVTENLPTTDGNATDGENSADESIPDKPVTERIVEYVQAYFEEISVIVTLIAGIVYEIRKHRKLNGSIGTLNNNAVTIAENSATAIASALSGVESVAKVVEEYKDEFAAVLEEIRKSAEEKKSLEDTLKHIETFLKTVKLATLEMSNEVAELLVLANIPNSKKDELYARHTKAVHELEVVEEEGNNEESEG